jgi:N-terminal domain of anti-restriction factor ArdC
MSAYKPRVPAGVPAGGEFSAKVTAEVSLDLAEPTAAGRRTVPELALSDMDKNDRIEAMRSEIDRALDELSDPECWARYLEAVSRFHRYSFANTWLIIAQRPDASRVAGFNDWRNKHNRLVRKGEKAIWVQAPMTKKVVEVNPDSGAEGRSPGSTGSVPSQSSTCPRPTANRYPKPR